MSPDIPRTASFSYLDSVSFTVCHRTTMSSPTLAMTVSRSLRTPSTQIARIRSRRSIMSPWDSPMCGRKDRSGSPKDVPSTRISAAAGRSTPDRGRSGRADPDQDHPRPAREGDDRVAVLPVRRLAVVADLRPEKLQLPACPRREEDTFEPSPPGWSRPVDDGWLGNFTCSTTGRHEEDGDQIVAGLRTDALDAPELGGGGLPPRPRPPNGEVTADDADEPRRKTAPRSRCSVPRPPSMTSAPNPSRARSWFVGRAPRRCCPHRVPL